MAGHIRQRGNHSWEIRFEMPSADGRRKTQTRTIHGTRRDAQKALNAALAAIDDGTYQGPTRVTIGEFVLAWVAENDKLRIKTRERYAQLARQQIAPHLGATKLDQLTPRHVREWHRTLLEEGGLDGKPLHPRTVGHAHRVLRAALAQACADEVLKRNVAALIKPPSVPEQEIQIMAPEELAALLPRLAALETTQPLAPIAALAVGGGLRRGEILGLAWKHFDAEIGTVAVTRTLSETEGGRLHFEPPKTRHGRRLVELDQVVVDIVLAHRRRINMTRLKLGLGGVGAEDLIFADAAGNPPSPDNLSRDWARLRRRIGLPHIRLHDLRHTSVSVLVRDSIDPVAIARRVGHGSASFTLRQYAHLFNPDDRRSANALGAALRGRAPEAPAAADSVERQQADGS